MKAMQSHRMFTLVAALAAPLYPVLARQSLPPITTVSPSADQTVCLPSKICVSVAMLEAEFKGYVTDEPAPTLVLRQRLIDVNRLYASEAEQRASLQGQIGPLQAQVNALRLKEAQDALDADFIAAAPIGMTWDGNQRKYIKKKDGGDGR